jgi:xanthine dehydrogenase YagR molybdenum-binding subunit
VAEIALTGVAPAIANAVYNATGHRVRHLPMTPDRLLNVL